jgi:Flp pilus assembly protein TadG
VMPARGHRGSAPVEFVLVSSLLVAVVLALIQVSIVVHVRHTLIASAQEGARWASYYDTQMGEGVALTRRLIAEGLSPGYAQSVTVTPGTVAGRPGVRVIVTAPLPAVGLWSGGGSLRVWADAPLERPQN